MNIILLFLILIILITILWHINLVKREKLFHGLIIKQLEREFQLHQIKQNSSNLNFKHVIDFKLSIIIQQVELLKEISNTSENLK